MSSSPRAKATRAVEHTKRYTPAPPPPILSPPTLGMATDQGKLSKH